jgi:hypothetical protein
MLWGQPEYVVSVVDAEMNAGPWIRAACAGVVNQLAATVADRARAVANGVFMSCSPDVVPVDA